MKPRIPLFIHVIVLAFLFQSVMLLRGWINDAHALEFDPDLGGYDIEIPLSERKDDYNLDKLAKAVAVAETGGCKLGSAKTHNNCYGIMHWPNGKRQFKPYKSKEDSVADFKRIWSSYYGRYPDLRLAKKWTGSDRPSTWLANVNAVYSSL